MPSPNKEQQTIIIKKRGGVGVNINGWRYYNYAAVPTSAPHEDPNLLPLEDKSIWKMQKMPLLARWTTDFDCGYETNWWYLIRSAPFDLEDVSAKERKSIRQALKKSYAKKISITEYLDELYECYSAAFSQYENADNLKPKDQFINLTDPSLECWGGFDVETDKLIGYMTVAVYDVYAEIQIAKFDPAYFKQQASDALYFAVLSHYLGERKKTYVCSGSRNINHKTGTQEYKIRRFGYRKAYCHLHVEYNPKVKPIIKVLYIFRKLFRKLDKITRIHQINGVLLMEELVREQKYLK